MMKTASAMNLLSVMGFSFSFTMARFFTGLFYRTAKPILSGT